ncbi:MAG: hypothetical protein QOJ80_2115 [Mycobacterium sp.]|jgi:uncharacterized protein (DUF305 family)|nr:hypothetical protein [Mycobacterium sp.]
MKSFSVRLLLLLVTAVVVSSCGHPTPTPKVSSTTEQPAITGAPAGFNADDVTFATNMIANYRQTTQLTALVPDRSTNPALIKLASDIDAAQQPEFEMVKVFLVQWNADSEDNSGQSGNGTPVPGMVDDETMARLEALRGNEFDTQWLQSMIGHQQGVVTMAEAETAHGTNVDAVATAKQLIGTYQAQLGRMQLLLGSG